MPMFKRNYTFLNKQVGLPNGIQTRMKQDTNLSLLLGFLTHYVISNPLFKASPKLRSSYAKSNKFTQTGPSCNNNPTLVSVTH